MMIYRQFTYHINKDLGFNNGNILFAWIKINEGPGNRNFDMIREKIVAEPEIKNACISSNIPFNGTSGTNVSWEGAYEGDQLNIRRNWVNYDYTSVFGLNIVRGRNFSREIPSDLNDGCIINETAAKSFGWTEPIGKKIYDISGKEYQVVGVVNDHHLYTTILKIPPSMMLLHDGNTQGTHIYSFKLSEGKTFTQAKEKISAIFKEYFPDSLFDLQLMADDMNYESLKIYRGMANSIGFFSIITIGIAIVGLFGLVAYSTKRKTKEIGIRKIHGASPRQIFSMLAREYIQLLIIAVLIALPLGKINKIMDPAEIKVASSAWEYLFSTGIILLIAFTTIIYHTIYASVKNPVDSLRYE